MYHRACCVEKFYKTIISININIFINIISIFMTKDEKQRYLHSGCDLELQALLSNKTRCAFNGFRLQASKLSHLAVEMFQKF